MSGAIEKMTGGPSPLRYISTYIYIHMCIYIYVYIYIYTCICPSFHIYLHVYKGCLRVSPFKAIPKRSKLATDKMIATYATVMARQRNQLRESLSQIQHNDDYNRRCQIVFNAGFHRFSLLNTKEIPDEDL